MVTRQKLFKYMVFIFVVVALSNSLEVVLGAGTNWVSLISVSDKTSNTPVPVGQPLLAGHSYNVTLQVDVPFTQSGSNFVLTLDNLMTLTGSQYWYLLTKNYGGYDPASFRPGEKGIQFDQVEGKLQLSVLFSVPADITTKQALGMTYRFLQKDYPVVQVTVTGGSMVGSQTFNLSDSSIENYLKTADQKSNLVPSGQIDKSYDPLIKAILAQADVIYNLGLPEKATDILNVVNTSNFPAPPSNSLQTVLFGAVALVAIIAVVAFLMFSRANSRASMRASAIDQTRNELASLEITAARFDEALAGQLKSLREKLGEEA